MLADAETLAPPRDGDGVGVGGRRSWLRVDLHGVNTDGSVVKNPPANAGDTGFESWVRNIPWRRKWQPTSVFLPAKSHGQKSLAGYSPWGHN